MQSINHKRKEAMFLRAISEIVSEEITNSNMSYPTVTAVKLSNDAGHVLVYVTFINNPLKSLDALNGAKGFIKSRLAKLPNLRKIPTITFKIDDTLERAGRIEEILKKINDEEAK